MSVVNDKANGPQPPFTQQEIDRWVRETVEFARAFGLLEALRRELDKP